MAEEKKSALLGFQEMNRLVEKDENKEFGKAVKDMLENGYYDHEETNLFGVGWIQKEQRANPMTQADANAIYESVKKIPLREFLARSGTTGIAGAAYLIPTKIYATLAEPAALADIVGDISMAVLPADQIGGSTMKVDVIQDGSMKVSTYISGAQMPTETLTTVQATLDFTKIYEINPRITNDLIEDSQFDLIELHLRKAGELLGEKATDLAVTDLATGTDGDGTVNSGASGDQDETRWTGATTTDCVDAIKGNLNDNFVSDTMVISHESMLNSVISTTGVQYSESPIYGNFVTGGWPTKIGPLNVIYCDTDYTTTTKTYADCKTIIFTKAKSLLSGRKRWMRIENYSDPVKDLVGLTASFRQDSVSVYNDSIFRITET